MLRSSGRAAQRLRLSATTIKQGCATPLLSNSQYARSFHLSINLREVVKVPQMAESISEGTLKQWLKKKGDYVEVDEEVATIETDKIDVSVNAPSAGTITELFAEEEDTVAVGNDLFKIEAGEKPSGGGEKAAPEASEQKKESASEKKEEPKQESSEQSKRKAPTETDAVKQKEDVPQRKAPEASEQPRQPAPSSSAPSSKPSSSPSPPAKGEQSSGSGNRTERRVKMNSMRKRIAERLKQSQNTAASLTTFNEIDMSALIALRGSYKDRLLKDKGIKLGFMGAFTKLLAWL